MATEAAGALEACRMDSTDTDASARTSEWLSRTNSAAGPSSAGTRALFELWFTDIKDFRDLVELHRGRHSTVFSAVCKRTGRTVVIKGYNRDGLKPRQLANVQREISLLKFFRESGCKGVVSLLATFEDAATLYLVFEACMRGDLYQLLMKNRGSLHEEFVCTKVVFPLLSVLQQLHQLHVVHRDIKPENIFIDESGDIALGDFGLAAHKFQDRLTERVGTLDYMAPEVLSIPAAVDGSPDKAPAAAAGDAPRTYDEKVDVWAAGVLVYELLCGRPPFEVEDPKETARLIMAAEVTKYPVHVSQLARDFVGRALCRNPADRPSAEELLQHAWLKHYFGGKVPDSHAAFGGVTIGLLKSWLVTSWSNMVRPPSISLKPNSLAPNRLRLSPATSPRRALSTGDDPCPLAQRTDIPGDLQPSSSLYKRKSLPGGSDAGSDSPSERELRSKYDSATGSGARRESAAPADQLERALSFNAGSNANRLNSSQFPSRDSSAGSLDNVMANDRSYARNDSGASASSSISIASFASLQHVPGAQSMAELPEGDDMGMVQRSASMCPGTMSRPGASSSPFTSQAPLKPIWQSGSTGQAPAAAAASKKTPGKSRFAG